MPLSLAALQRAVELNGVAVDTTCAPSTGAGWQRMTGFAVLTGNIRDFAYLLQLIPAGWALLYRRP